MYLFFFFLIDALSCACVCVKVPSIAIATAALMLCVWPCILDDSNEVNDWLCHNVLWALNQFFPHVSHLSTILFCVPPRMLVLNVILSRQDSEKKKKLVRITWIFIFDEYCILTHQERHIQLVGCRKEVIRTSSISRTTSCDPLPIQIKTGLRLVDDLFIPGRSGSKVCQVSNYICLLCVE